MIKDSLQTLIKEVVKQELKFHFDPFDPQETRDCQKNCYRKKAVFFNLHAMKEGYAINKRNSDGMRVFAKSWHTKAYLLEF